MADKYLKETIQIPQVTPQDVVNATELFNQESQNPKSVILKNGALYAANNLLGFANHALREDDYLNDLKKYYRTNELDQKVDRSPLDRAVNYAGGYDWGMQNSVNDENLQDAINAARAYQLRDYVNSETDKRRNDAIKDYLENIAGMKAAMADKDKGIERDRNDIVNDAVIFSGRQNYAQGGDVDTDSIDSALSDYSQLLEAYPNARKFLSNVQDLREKNNFSPDDSQIASAILHPVEFAKRAGDKFNKNVNTLMGVRTVEPDSNIDIYGYTPQEQAESALDLAGLAGTGAMPFNSASSPGTAGMFLGMRAKNAPLDKFAAAKDLANEYGLHDAKIGSPEWMSKNKDIWSKTGIHYGYDMNPRFEISDLPFKVNTIGDFRNLIDESEANIAALSDESKAIRQAKKEKTPQTDLFEKELAKSRNQRLKDIEAEKESIQNEINKPFGIDYGAANASTFANIAFQHPEFFNNYSQIGNDVVVGFTPRIGGGGQLHNNKLDIFSDRDNPEARLTGIHELQHAIQRLEDWNRGGSPEVAPLIHHEIARQSLENALPKTKANYFEAQQLMDQSSPLRKVSFIHDLENIKQPRDLFNTDSWNKNLERVRDIIGLPPKYGSRLPYAQEAGKILAKFELADAPYDATQLYHSGVPREEIRRQLKNIDSKLNRRWDDWRSYNELLKNVSRTNPRINKFSDSDAYNMYKNLAGEAEARATEARLNLTPEERLSKFPLEDYDVKNPLVHYLSTVRSPTNYAQGGSIDTDSPESAISDYSQLLDAYPNANKFLSALKSSVMQHLPSQEDLRNPQKMMDVALNFGPSNLASGLAGVIKASHGSPHKFERFDLSKIGTGEGAQAYGHGAYFGEGYGSPVAMKYVPRNEKLDNKLLALHDIAEKRQQYPAMEVYEQYMLNRTPEEIEKYFADELPNYTKAEQAQILNAQKAAKDAYQKQKGSYLYDVDIKWPDPAREASDPLGKHHLLDWDVPLSEQSEFVKNALKNSNYDYGQLLGGGKIFNIDSPVKAGNAYQDLASKLDKQKVTEIIGPNSGASKSEKFANVSKHLHDLGIPGLKYLDQGSRGAGEGSHNIVMFGDEYPNIVSVNSKPVKKADGGEIDLNRIHSIINDFHQGEYGLRHDAETEKGRGYLNELKRPDGNVMTEYSIGVPIDGVETDIPTLVPELTIDEIKSILSMPEGGKIPKSIVKKAQEHAIKRVKEGKSVFATPEESEFGER